MYLAQLKSGGVTCRSNSDARLVNNANSVYDLAREAIDRGISLASVIEDHGPGDAVDLLQLYAAGELDCPLRHPDPAHMLLSGTGLTHLGSASARDAMHAAAAEGVTDSMKMFRMGLQGGKPEAGKTGVQPEWFYKGSGVLAVAPGDPLRSPGFALDGSEEPEIAGIYLIGPDGTPHRVGFAVANEFSDHVTERMNYLYLAHSKLRPASFGPELLVGELPQDIRGTSRIRRAGEILWQKEFLSGESNMSHSIANLEYHHFKYPLFRQPGDLHVHMFGTATLSFAEGIEVHEGDIIEVDAPQLGLALHNRVEVDLSSNPEVKAL